jgi:hypothetical protein
MKPEEGKLASAWKSEIKNFKKSTACQKKRTATQKDRTSQES